MSKKNDLNEGCRQFIEDGCTIIKGKTENKDDLYEAYREYCKSHGYLPLNRDNFFRERRTIIGSGVEKKWPDDLMIIPVKNGLVNVKKKKFIPGPHNYLFLPVGYHRTGNSALWQKFLNRVLPGKEGKQKQRLLQRFFGYCLLRDCRYQKALFLLGASENGKSIILNTLQELVGKENCASVSFWDLENQFHRAELLHKLLNITTECCVKANKSPYLKAVVSGDEINAAFKYQDVFGFRPFCKLVLAGSSLPRVGDDSYGFWRRLLVIGFNRQFHEDDPDRDPHLAEKLTEKLSGIFKWALDGLYGLLADGNFAEKPVRPEVLKQLKKQADRWIVRNKKLISEMKKEIAQHKSKQGKMDKKIAGSKEEMNRLLALISRA